jgi:hypothetical protein
MLQNDFFTTTIDEIHQHVLYLIFYFQGEPYLNPAFLDMVKYAHDKGIYTATSTNAHYLTDEKAKKCSLRESFNFDKDVIDKDIGIDMQNFYPAVLQILSEEEKPPSSASNSSVSNAAAPIKDGNSEELTTKQRAHMILQSLLYPTGVTVKQFYSKFWEKEPLYISASSDDNNTEPQGKWSAGRSRHPATDRFKGFFSSDSFIVELSIKIS